MHQTTTGATSASTTPTPAARSDKPALPRVYFRIADLRERYSIGRSAVYRLIDGAGGFPAPIYLHARTPLFEVAAVEAWERARGAQLAGGAA